MNNQIKWIKTGSKIVLNILFYSVIVTLVLFSIANMQLKEKNDIANIFGNGFVSVITDSMDGDQPDSFTIEDLLFVKVLDDESRALLEVGDIITYYDFEIDGLPGKPAGFITHRIISIFELDDEVFFVTQGDKFGALPDDPIHISEAIAVYQSKWQNAGTALKYLQTPQGFALVVILPVALLLIFEGVMLTRNILAVNREKMNEQLKEQKEQVQLHLESEKEKIRQQILEELKKQQETKQ